MKKYLILLSFVLFFVSLETEGQILFGKTQNEMIITSINDYFKEFSYTPCHISTNGLSSDFPYDSLGLVPFNMSDLSNNSKDALNKMKRGDGIGVLEIKQEILEDTIVFCISKTIVTMPRKRRFEIARTEDFVYSVFRFSCDDLKWHHITR